MRVELVGQIRGQVEAGDFEFSRHALDQGLRRRISVDDLRQAIAVCELIEDYPDDKYGPSCLLLGFTIANRPLHVQCSHPSRPLVKIVTMYEPDPVLWDSHRRRRS